MEMSGTISSSDDEPVPHVEIIEQPKARGYRFRYDCEGKTAGCIPGVKSVRDKKTYPSFKLVNTPPGCKVIVVISCVTDDSPHRPHPHRLVGKDCDKGVCTMHIRQSKIVQLQHIGIQCVKKKEVRNSLLQRDEIKVDPFNTSYDADDNYDLKKVRLAIQPFIHNKVTGQHIPVPPVVTNVINDQKGDNELVIMRRDRTSGQAKGGDEMFLLTEKVNKDDINVQFYDETDGWQEWGNFSANDVHKQYAIVIQTPRYRKQHLSQPKTVQMRLFRQSDESYSEPLPYTYMPNETDPFSVNRKRKKREQLNLPGPSPINVPKLAAFQEKQEGVTVTQDMLQRLIERTLGNNINRNSATHTVTSTTVNEQQQTITVPVSQTTNQIQNIQQEIKDEEISRGVTMAQSSSAMSPSGIQYPRQQIQNTSTPCLDKLMPSMNKSELSAMVTSNSSAPIPAFVGQMSDNTPVSSAPLPTMLPGSSGTLPMKSQPLMETTPPSSVQQVTEQENPQYLFSMITTGQQAADSPFSSEDIGAYEVLESMGSGDLDTELEQYLNSIGEGLNRELRSDLLETDDGGFGSPTKSRGGGGRRKPKNK